MQIPGIYITLLGVSISGITSIILAYNSNVLIYTLIVLGIIITIFGSYLQYRESEIVKVRIDFQRNESGKHKYSYTIPYSSYKRKIPVITQVGIHNQPIWGFGYEILQNGDIVISTDDEVEGEYFFLIH